MSKEEPKTYILIDGYATVRKGHKHISEKKLDNFINKFLDFFNRSNFDFGGGYARMSETEVMEHEDKRNIKPTYKPKMSNEELLEARNFARQHQTYSEEGMPEDQFLWWLDIMSEEVMYHRGINRP